MNTIFLAFSIKNSSVSEFFLELSNQLVLKNRIIIISDSNEPHFFKISSKIEIFKWPTKRPNTFKDFVFLFKLVWKYKPSTMISNFGAVNIFLTIGFLLDVGNRIAWYHTLSAQLEQQKFLRFRKRLFYKMATKIIANSSAAKKDLIGNFGVDKNKIDVVYNAVRDNKISCEKVLKNKLLYVGRMSPVKGVDVLINAMPIVLKEFPDIELILIGGNVNGEEIKDYKKIAEKLDVEGHILFTGNMGKPKLYEEFASAYLTIVPSRVEAFGYVVIESFSVKTPVIGSNTSGIAEIIRDNIDGFLFQPGNHIDLAEKIIVLLKDENLRKFYSANCYNRFKNKFEINAAVKKLIPKLGIEKPII